MAGYDTGWTGRPPYEGKVMIPFLNPEPPKGRFRASGWRIFAPTGQAFYDVPPELPKGPGLYAWSISRAIVRADNLARDLNRGGLPRERALRECGR